MDRSCGQRSEAADLLQRQRSFGGTQPYTAYLSTKLDLVAVAQDLTIPF